MTKAEFTAQFKRLRIAGYRLPVFDGVTVKDVVDEWYATFGSCSVSEFSHAINCLKQTKTDTFWPASGELWTHIRQYRKERRIRAEANAPSVEDGLSAEQRQAFLESFREFRDSLMAKMSMPHAEAQVEPDEVLRDQEEREREA